MTVKKVIQIVDYLIKRKTERKSDFLDPKHSWNQSNEKILKDIISIISGFMQEEINSLEMVRNQIVPDCKHPKEDIDLDPETKQPYCMGCNLDL